MFYQNHLSVLHALSGQFTSVTCGIRTIALEENCPLVWIRVSVSIGLGTIPRGQLS